MCGTMTDHPTSISYPKGDIFTVRFMFFCQNQFQLSQHRITWCIQSRRSTVQPENHVLLAPSVSLDSPMAVFHMMV